ncbi:MAG TPA: ROK family transcriptional regulator [Arachidicoccus sp.]|nr:ROK family transcriptional regulator [Arachidicoccus sp.]
MKTNKQNTEIQLALRGFTREGKKGLLKVKILKSIFDLKEASISNICDNLNLSIPTVTNLMAELTNAGWLEIKGEGLSKGGRKPVMMGLVSHLFYTLCIDIELFAVKIAIFDNNLNLCGKISFPFILSKTREHIEIIVQNAESLLESTQIRKEQLIGISICMPGLVNPSKGVNYFYLCDANNKQSLAEYFKLLFGVPVTIQNDVNAAALGELECGKAKGARDALVILMDWGVGLGIIMDGKVRKGALGFSGEIGHIPFESNGELCYCGKQGCLETVASGVALIKLAKEGIKSGQHSILYELCNHDVDNIETTLIIEAANKGDLFAIKLLSQVGSAIGKCISTLIQIFNPELIVLEGRIAAAEQFITLPMMQAINTYCMTQIRENTKIEVSELAESANLIGCAVEGIHQFLVVDTD